MIMFIIFIALTACNLFLQYKVKFTDNVMDSWENIYVRPFIGGDIVVAVGIVIIVTAGMLVFIKKIYPGLCNWVSHINEKEKKHISQRRIFGFIFCVWFFFFLVFYPGTAMNDTIYILQDPCQLSYQHPILYNLYTYGFYKIGCTLGDPDLGLALLSLTQMIAMDYVLSKAIVIANNKGVGIYFCRTLILYFAFAPLFFTYAFSAIKDTPFSIVLFYFLLFLLEIVDSKGQCLQKWTSKLRFALCIFALISFRNNGIIIVLGTVIVLMIKYHDWRKQLFMGTFCIIIFQKVLCGVLMPDGAKPLFQEKIGVPLQQVAAVMAKDGVIDQEQKEYLCQLLPEEEWKKYAPGCADTIKWNEHFDRDYLEQSKWQFVKVWGQLFVTNPGLYTEAYLLNTYGIWGIETRNGAQYYVKGIYKNNLGLIQKSLVSDRIHTIFYKFYCNKFTYGYLSLGTAIWILLAVTLYMVKSKMWNAVIVVCPLWFLWGSLLAATPIAFAFRYGFIFAMTLPFYILTPFIMKQDMNEQEEGKIRGE